MIKIEKQLNKETALVCKHNNLINATYKLNLGEQKLVLAITSMVNPKDEEFKDYYITIEEFAELMGIDIKTNSSLYSRLKRKSGLLLSKRLTIHEPDGDLQVTWFSSIKYYDKEGKMALSFSPKLKKYYLQLKEYTKYRLKNIAKLNSKHSIRVYELLKQYEKIGVREFDLDTFKESIGIDKTSYKTWNDLRKRVLLITEKELKEKTDLSFRFEAIKKGRRVSGIRFFITSRKAQDETAASLWKDSKYIDKVKAIFKENITTLEAKKLLDSAEGNINLIKEKYEMSKQCSNIDNLVGWIISAVKEDYKKHEKKSKEGSFCDYDQRSYNFDELEKELLSWSK